MKRMGKQFYQRLIFAVFVLVLTVPFLWHANERQRDQHDFDFFQLEVSGTKDEVVSGQESKLVSEWSAEALMKRDVSTMLYFSNKDWPSFSPENRGTCPHKLSYYIPEIPITFTTEVRGFVQERFLDNHTFVPTDVAMEMGILQLFETSPCRTYNSTEADLYVVPYMHSSDCNYQSFKINVWQDSCRQVNTSRIRYLRASVPESVPIERQVFIGMQHEAQTRDHLRLYDDRHSVENMIKAKVTTGERQRNGIFAMPVLNLFPRFQPSVMSQLDESWWTRPRKYAFAAIYGGLSEKLGRRGYQPRCMRIFFFEQLERHHNNTEDFAGTGLPYLASIQTFKEVKKLEKQGYEYDDSILCPILAGDSPYLTRFFDVMLKGCIPVVPEFHLKKPGINSEILRGEKLKSWWLPEAITPCTPRSDMSKRSFDYPISNIVETYPFISSLSTYNNTNDSKNQEWAVDYRSFVVVAPMIEGKDQDFTPMFEAMEKVLKNPEEIRRRQLNMKKYILRFTLGLGLDAHKYGDSFDSLLKLFELYKDGL